MPPSQPALATARTPQACQPQEEGPQEWSAGEARRAEATGTGAQGKSHRHRPVGGLPGSSLYLTEYLRTQCSA